MWMSSLNQFYRIKNQENILLHYIITACILILFVSLGFLSKQDFWYSHEESRRAEIGRELLDSDSNLLIPTLNGKPILSKPPVFYWMEYLSFRLLDRQDESSARMPSVLFGLLSLILILYAGWYLWDWEVGFSAMLITASTFFYMSYLRKAEIDMTFNTTILFSLIFLLRSLKLLDQNTANDPTPEIIQAIRRNFTWFWILAGLAFMVKGPYALVFPLGGLVAAIISLRNRYHLKLLRYLFVNIGVLLFLLETTPWFLYVANHQKNAFTFVHKEINELYPSDIFRKKSVFYYPLELSVYAPWFLFIPPAMVMIYRKRNIVTRFLIWYPIIGMLIATLISQKKSVYILPLYPAFAITIALYFKLISQKVESFPKHLTYIRSVFLFCYGLLIIAGISSVVILIYYSVGWSNLIWNICLVIVILILTTKSGNLIYKRNTIPTTYVWTLSFTVLLLYAIIFHNIFPLFNDYNGLKKYAVSLNQKVPSGQQIYIYEVDNYSLPFYAKRTVTVIDKTSNVPTDTAYIVVHRKHLDIFEGKGSLTTLLENKKLIPGRYDNVLKSWNDLILIHFIPDTKSINDDKNVLEHNI